MFKCVQSLAQIPCVLALLCSLNFILLTGKFRGNYVAGKRALFIYLMTNVKLGLQQKWVAELSGARTLPLLHGKR